MNRGEAVIYLLKSHVPGHPSRRYGVTEFARAVVAWKTADRITDNQSEITPELLDAIIESVDRGDAVIEGLEDVG